MKKSEKIILMASVAAVGAYAVQKTRQRQKTAKAENRHIPYGPYEAVFKRPLDVLTAAAALVPLAPVMGAVALLVRIRLGSPVLFCQKRPGKDGRIFTLYKFRTMTDERDENGRLLPDEERLTAFGRWLRSTSLDELPELFNILKGDMSVVGPRPLLVEYLPRYSGRQRRRHDVRPGLTGLAQVDGRNSQTWEERFEDDVRYVEHVTFSGDLKILLRTAAVVLRREGISSNTAATMEKFVGNGQK